MLVVGLFVLVIKGMEDPKLQDNKSATFIYLSSFRIMKIHIGHLIQEELKKQGRTVIWFASQIPCNRNNVYLIFKKATIDTELLIRISKILNHDFLKDISNLTFE